MNLDQILSDLKQERSRLDQAIAALENISGKHSQMRKISGNASAVVRKVRRGLSEAGRRRISQAMKKRWAEHRAKASTTRKPAKAA